MYSKELDFFLNLSKTGFKRLGMLFNTINNQYFYDAGTGKVFACEPLEYDILNSFINYGNLECLSKRYTKDDIIKGINELYALSNEEHIFQLPTYHEFSKNIKENFLSQIILEVTQECNLRCKYCIFQEEYSTYRTFQNKDMSWYTAKKAIDYAMEKSNDKLSIGFYGGEPLLNFNLIKRSIDYCTTYYSNKDISYSITSNLTLVNEDIATYLSNIRNLTILCSIDGPEKLHNAYRIYKNGQGSYNKTMAGFHLLKQKLDKRSNQVLSINSVVCPPYSSEKLKLMKNFFENTEIFPQNLNCRYSYVSYGSLKDSVLNNDMQKTPKSFYRQELKDVNPIKCWNLNNLIYKKNVQYEKSLEQFDLIKMQNRYLVDSPSSIAMRNGCCNPGYERLYVTVDGKFKICEKIGESPYIGDVEKGLNTYNIEKKYIQEYDAQSLNKCNQCWAIHLCDLCYCTCYDANGLDMCKKGEMCAATKSSIKNNLIEYYQLLELNPDLINEFTGIDLNKSN